MKWPRTAREAAKVVGQPSGESRFWFPFKEYLRPFLVPQDMHQRLHLRLRLLLKLQLQLGLRQNQLPSRVHFWGAIPNYLCTLTKQSKKTKP